MADWRERAVSYLNHCGQGAADWCHVEPAEGVGGAAAARIDGALLTVGDKVSIWSRLTGEEFQGEMTAVVGPEVFVRLTGNIPTRLHMDHLRTGRLKLRRLAD
ncbi:hypothetical protein JKP88DRAFT_230311 [Tribonema minus]|uniref:Uncharacterized protein n=1 Tax=Tribonema minus TaxID=303371 RepID=A0A836CNX5_9STRA|nr:hypothetical protein JKP88DRAFT_230311 [Tribonema minus]